MTSCGFTPSEVDEMTLFDVNALFTYWREFPPVHEILTCVHGIAQAPKPVPVAGDPSGIGSLITRFPNGKVRSS
jgi:hypothetical protein